MATGAMVIRVIPAAHPDIAIADLLAPREYVLDVRVIHWASEDRANRQHRPTVSEPGLEQRPQGIQPVLQTKPIEKDWDLRDALVIESLKRRDNKISSLLIARLYSSNFQQHAIHRKVGTGQRQ
ncbi:hypothetical protein D9M69_697070 [compost metagenome]